MRLTKKISVAEFALLEEAASGSASALARAGDIEGFFEEFFKDITTSVSGVSRGRLVRWSATTGVFGDTTVVTFYIRPASDPASRTPIEVVEEMRRQLVTPGSKLLGQTLTSFLDGRFGVQATEKEVPSSGPETAESPGATVSATGTAAGTPSGTGTGGGGGGNTPGYADATQNVKRRQELLIIPTNDRFLEVEARTAPTSRVARRLQRGFARSQQKAEWRRA